MMHEAWRSIEEVPCCFSRLSIKFQGHTYRKTDNLNPIWVRLLGRSQLSNPSDLPCLMFKYSKAIVKRCGDKLYWSCEKLQSWTATPTLGHDKIINVTHNCPVLILLALWLFAKPIVIFTFSDWQALVVPRFQLHMPTLFHKNTHIDWLNIFIISFLTSTFDKIQPTKRM